MEGHIKFSGLKRLPGGGDVEPNGRKAVRWWEQLSRYDRLSLHITASKHLTGHDPSNIKHSCRRLSTIHSVDEMSMVLDSHDSALLIYLQYICILLFS